MLNKEINNWFNGLTLRQKNLIKDKWDNWKLPKEDIKKLNQFIEKLSKKKSWGFFAMLDDFTLISITKMMKNKR